jgi:glycosyltransferase involved in cell wall biosynthesis
MKIGLEAERANHPHPTGVEHYAAQVIKGLARLDHVNQYILYFRTKPQQWFYELPSNFKLKVLYFPKFWIQIRLSLEMLLHPVDVLVILASALPLFHTRKAVITAHDIAFEIFSGIYTGFNNYYQKFFARFAVWRATKILAVSDATKQDLIKIYKTNPSKISVTHLGVGSEFKPLPYESVQHVLDKHSLSYKKYILFLGTLQPRKNIIKLIDAYLKLKKDYRIEEKLVIGGGRGWLWEPIMEKIEEAKSSGVVYLDYISENERAPLYNGASVFCLVSNYEGFGLPPLEAMACGTPVVVSNISSLPEVVGDAGELVDPSSADSIAEGILKVLMDKNLQTEMSKKGIEQARKFTWEETARKTLEVLESLKN